MTTLLLLLSSLFPSLELTIDEVGELAARWQAEAHGGDGTVVGALLWVLAGGGDGVVVGVVS